MQLQSTTAAPKFNNFANNINKLSSQRLQAPLFRGRSFVVPRIVPRGQTPANTALLPGGPASGIAAPAISGGGGGGAQEDGIQREEVTSFKEVNGESVRSVVGSYGYQSPEGLAVSFK